MSTVTHRNSRKLKPFPYKQTGNTERLLYLGGLCSSKFILPIQAKENELLSSAQSCWTRICIFLLLLLAKECDLTPPLIYYPKQLFFFFRFVYLISLICFFKFCEEFPFVYVAAENQASLPKSKVMFVSHTVQF